MELKSAIPALKRVGTEFQALTMASKIDAVVIDDKMLN